MARIFMLLILSIVIAFPAAIFSFNINDFWCSSCDDPHIRTFDGRLYDFMFNGDNYILHNDFEDTRVTASYRPCNKGASKPTCNCGVHIKYKNAYLFLDNCGAQSSSILTKQLYYLQPPIINVPIPVDCNAKRVPPFKDTDDNWWNTPGNAVSILDQRFLCAVSAVSPNVIFIRTNNPSMNKNIYVKLTVNDRGISCIYVRPSLNSFGSTGGLCGTFNQKPQDDISIYNPKTCGLVLTNLDGLANFWQLSRHPPPEFPSNQLDFGSCPCDPVPLPPNPPNKRCMRLPIQCTTNLTISFPLQDYIRPNLIKPVTLVIAQKYCNDLFNPIVNPLIAGGLITNAEVNLKKGYCVADYQLTGDAFWAVAQLDQILILGRQSCGFKNTTLCNSIQKPAKCFFPDYADLFIDGQPYEPCPKLVCHPKVL